MFDRSKCLCLLSLLPLLSCVLVVSALPRLSPSLPLPHRHSFVYYLTSPFKAVIRSLLLLTFPIPLSLLSLMFVVFILPSCVTFPFFQTFPSFPTFLSFHTIYILSLLGCQLRPPVQDCLPSGWDHKDTWQLEGRIKQLATISHILIITYSFENAVGWWVLWAHD